jgi:hypothetical protein
MSKLQKLLVSVSVLLLVALIGCSTFQDSIIPCWIEERVGNYTEEPMTSILPYTTIADAERQMDFMQYVHETKQLGYLRLSEDDERFVQQMNKIQTDHLIRAQELRDNIFNEDGAGGLLLSTLLGGTLGWTLLSKPSDKKEIEKLKNGA